FRRRINLKPLEEGLEHAILLALRSAIADVESADDAVKLAGRLQRAVELGVLVELLLRNDLQSQIWRQQAAQVRVDRLLVEARGYGIDRAVILILARDDLDLRLGRIPRRKLRQERVSSAAGHQAEHYQLRHGAPERAPHGAEIDIVGGGGGHVGGRFKKTNC